MKNAFRYFYLLYSMSENNTNLSRLRIMKKCVFKAILGNGLLIAHVELTVRGAKRRKGDRQTHTHIHSHTDKHTHIIG